ncbi:uncharacterized protein Ecym_4442 [Eremothecium cymbalariae DBVPG|uniref:Uncharacterized protein n=1 Tax=Eremothecium cymbalariae (strain CBS 270.75 / DBVPG 7215 / KCTC 17166 / NRRL Y-17582) TaxID=931890 RepID=G8JTY4_ERECY|nr:hypothetical protein Ecym_4442 [Eremothecium cymbalariae DBVPG\
MFRTNLFQNKIDAYSNHTAKRKLLKLYDGDELDTFLYLSEKGELEDAQMIGSYLDGMDGDTRAFHLFIGRLLCLYDVTHEQYVNCLSEFEKYPRNVLYPKLDNIFEVQHNCIGFHPLGQCYKRMKQRFDAEVQQLLRRAYNQRKAIEEQLFKRNPQRKESLKFLEARISTVINWEDQECLTAGIYDKELQDNMVAWFIRVNKKVIEKLSSRTARIKTYCKSWLNLESQNCCYWSVLESVLQNDDIYYDCMLEKLKRKAFNQVAPAGDIITLSEFQEVAEHFKTLRSSFILPQDCDDSSPEQLSPKSNAPPKSPLPTVTNKVCWKRPKPRITFSGKLTRVYHPYQSPGDYLIDIPHNNSLEPGPLDVETTYQQFSTKFKDVTVIYVRWDFVEKSGQSPGTGPFGWFFLMFRNGGYVPVYITERVHKVVFEQKDGSYNKHVEDDELNKMNWPDELKMPVSNNRVWEGRSVYIPMDEFAKELVFRTKEAVVGNYIRTMRELEELEQL